MRTLVIISILFSFNVLSNPNLIYEAKDKKIELEESDKEILKMGEISTARYVTAGMVFLVHIR